MPAPDAPPASAAPTGAAPRGPRRPGRLVAGLLIAGLAALLFLVLEGGAGVLLAVYEAARGPDGPTHTRYDALLGWVNAPGVSLQNAWGPGNNLHISPEGFRGSGPETPVSGGRQRVLCVGDSFTFGEGVDDDDVWCNLLANDSLHTLNLGQPGYGVDQAFLRYRRDGAGLPHDVVVFAFIGGDLTRMGRSSHHGYAKPVLAVEGDSLVVRGVPVPRVIPRLNRFVIDVSEHLRTVELAGRLLRRLTGPAVSHADREHRRVAPLATRVLVAVHDLANVAGATPVFVYLPIRAEMVRDGLWRSWVRTTMDSLGYPLVDLTDSLRGFPATLAADLFIPEGAPAGGHYSRRGNAWVADVLRPWVRGAEIGPDGRSVADSPSGPG